MYFSTTILEPNPEPAQLQMSEIKGLAATLIDSRIAEASTSPIRLSGSGCPGWYSDTELHGKRVAVRVSRL